MDIFAVWELCKAIEKTWRILSIFALKKIRLGNLFDLCENNNNNTISEVERDVNFVPRFLDLELKLSVGCNDEE